MAAPDYLTFNRHRYQEFDYPPPSIANAAYRGLIFTNHHDPDDWFLYVFSRIPDMGDDTDTAEYYAHKYFLGIKRHPDLEHTRIGDTGPFLSVGTKLVMPVTTYSKYTRFEDDYINPDEMCRVWDVKPLLDHEPEEITNCPVELKTVLGYMWCRHETLVPLLNNFGRWLCAEDEDNMEGFSFIIHNYNRTGVLVEFPYKYELVRRNSLYSHYVRQNAIRWLGFKTKHINVFI